MSVDRSLISLLRNGKRGMPQNKLHIKRMAESFAKRITTVYQRQAIAEISGLPGMRTEVSAEILAVQLERWLRGDIDLVEHILDGIEQESAEFREITAPKISVPEGETFFFYGDKGRRDALRFFIGNIKDGMIGIFDNTNLDWISSDPLFAAEIQTHIRQHLNRGNMLTQILPPISNINCYTDSLHFLLPIYTEGNVNVFYYPRMMDMTRNVILVVVPGQCVSYSYGFNSDTDNMITIVSTDKEFINAHAEQFNYFRSLCRPALKVHREPQEFPKMLLDFISLNGDVCQKTLPLPTLSMSVELAAVFAEQTDDFLWKEAFQKVSSAISVCEKHLLTYKHIDISPLSSVKDIVAGRIPVASPYMPKSGYPVYTPETYLMHLENILRLMDTYENYTFIPMDREIYQGYNLMVNDGGTALLSHGQKNLPMIMEFHRPEIVLSCKEHLMRIVDREGGIKAVREKTKKRLTALMSELKKAIKAKV